VKQTRAYVNACAYAEELDVAQHRLRSSRSSTMSRQRNSVTARPSQFDVARAAELVAQTRATLPVYESGRRTALFELAVLTGRPPEEKSRKMRIPANRRPKLAAVLPVATLTVFFRRRRMCEKRSGNSPPTWPRSA